jgi:hypothetical protein
VKDRNGVADSSRNEGVREGDERVPPTPSFRVERENSGGSHSRNETLEGKHLIQMPRNSNRKPTSPDYFSVVVV